jgi:DNA-binding IscR family transcriptional regulator
VLNVVEALDGPIEPATCTTGEPCARRPVCSVGDVWIQAKLAVEEVLGGISIQELAERESSLEGTSMYYI